MQMLRKKSRFVSNGVLFVAVQMKVVVPLRWPDYTNKEIKSSKLLLPTQMVVYGVKLPCSVWLDDDRHRIIGRRSYKFKLFIWNSPLCLNYYGQRCWGDVGIYFGILILQVRVNVMCLDAKRASCLCVLWTFRHERIHTKRGSHVKMQFEPEEVNDLATLEALDEVGECTVLCSAYFNNKTINTCIHASTTVNRPATKLTWQCYYLCQRLQSKSRILSKAPSTLLDRSIFYFLDFIFFIFASSSKGRLKYVHE